jgi:hypothetical protein
MKKIQSFLLALLLSATTLLNAQSSEPFVGAKTITIQTRQSGASAYNSWARHLEKEGIRPDRNDPIQFTANSLPVLLKKQNCEFVVNTKVTDFGDIRITIQWRYLTADSTKGQTTDFRAWEYDEGKKSISQTIYNEIWRVVETYGVTLIRYSR